MKELEGGESEAPSLDLVRDDGFEGGEEGAQKGEGEAERGEVVVSCCCKADAGYDLVGLSGKLLVRYRC